jgi:hypothetical protein
VAVKGTFFVEELLKWLTPEDLEFRNIDGVTALHVAAQTGDVRIAKEMVKKNERLPLINNSRAMKPLHNAAHLGHKHMVDYLFSVTSFEDLTTVDRINLLHYTVTAGFYGMSYVLLIVCLRQSMLPLLLQCFYGFRTNIFAMIRDFFLCTDIALQILTKDPNLANASAATEFSRRALAELARKPFVIGCQSRLSLWKRLFNSC